MRGTHGHPLSANVTDELSARLASLRAGYGSLRGVPFEYFFCPILFRAENVNLCKDHVAPSRRRLRPR